MKIDWKSVIAIVGLMWVLATVTTGCAKNISEHTLIVKGEGVEFSMRVNAEDLSDARREARSLLVSRGYPVEQLNKLKFYEVN